jgi:hypothetical protein
MTTASRLIALSVLAVASGCARAVPEAAAPVSAPSPVAAMPAPAEEASAEEVHAVSESAAFTQKPGDYVVYRFSGKFYKSPLVLTQRAVEVSDTTMVVDLSFDDGKHKTNVRAHYTHAPGAAHEVTEASRIDASGAEQPMTVAEFDALMAQTALAADNNEGSIGSEQVTVSVGGHDVSCTQTRYRVVVGKRTATMRTVSSDSFAWGDLGGDIVSDDGRVLYRAEIVDAGGASPMVAASR